MPWGECWVECMVESSGGCLDNTHPYGSPNIKAFYKNGVTVRAKLLHLMLAIATINSNNQNY